MEKNYEVLEDNSVVIRHDGIIKKFSNEEVIEIAIQYYEAAGFIPGEKYVDSLDYDLIIQETLL